MALFITLGSVFLFCVLIALIPIGLKAEYNEHGFIVALKILFFKIIVYDSAAKPDKKTVKKPEKKPVKEKKEGKKGGNLELFMKLLPDIKKLLSRFKRKLTIKLLIIKLTLASEYPASTAIMYGGTHAAFGIIMPLVDNNFKVKKRDISIGADFTLTKPVIYVEAAVSIFAGSIIAMAVSFALKYLKVNRLLS